MGCEELRHLHECASRAPVPATIDNILTDILQNRRSLSSVSSENGPSQEIVMVPSRFTLRISRFAFATAAVAAVLLPASEALASQGPGGGPGTAGELTQLVMAII